MNIILKYFPDLSTEQQHQFSQLLDLYTYWNVKINVISRKDIDELYLKHVLHSLGIAKVITFNSGTEILDVGTGGGFPGIPLAIFFPQCQFHLVDSIGKKLKVVESVSETLGLKNVKTTHGRVEAIRGTYDFVVSRAVTGMPTFVSWVQSMFNSNNTNALENGILYLKGGDLTEELIDFPQAKQFLLSTYYDEDFFSTKKVVHLKIR